MTTPQRRRGGEQLAQLAIDFSALGVPPRQPPPAAAAAPARAAEHSYIISPPAEEEARPAAPPALAPVPETHPGTFAAAPRSALHTETQAAVARLLRMSRDQLSWEAGSEAGGGSFLIFDTRHTVEAALRSPGLQERRGRRGQPAGVVAKFCRELLRLLGEVKPDYALVAVDRGPDPRRVSAWHGYRPRRPRPEGFAQQLQACEQVARALGCWVPDEGEVESRDVCASAVAAAPQQAKIHLLSHDPTLLSVGASQREILLAQVAGEPWMPAATWAVSQLGVTSERVDEFLALTGLNHCAPGVRGIGKVAARALIAAAPAGIAQLAAAVARGSISSKEVLKSASALLGGLRDLALSLDLIYCHRAALVALAAQGLPGAISEAVGPGRAARPDFETLREIGEDFQVRELAECDGN